jgi:hypothetical protein
MKGHIVGSRAAHCGQYEDKRRGGVCIKFYRTSAHTQKRHLILEWSNSSRLCRDPSLTTILSAEGKVKNRRNRASGRYKSRSCLSTTSPTSERTTTRTTRSKPARFLAQQ